MSFLCIRIRQGRHIFPNVENPGLRTSRMRKVTGLIVCSGSRDGLETSQQPRAWLDVMPKRDLGEEFDKSELDHLEQLLLLGQPQQFLLRRIMVMVLSVIRRYPSLREWWWRQAKWMQIQRQKINYCRMCVMISEGTYRRQEDESGRP